MELCRRAITFIDIMLNNIPPVFMAEKQENLRRKLSKEDHFYGFCFIKNKQHALSLNDLFTYRTNTCKIR